MIFQKDLKQKSEPKLMSSLDKMYLELDESHQPLSTLEIVHNELWVSSNQSIFIVCLDKLNVLQKLDYPFSCTVSSSCFMSTGQIFYRVQNSAKVLHFDVVCRQLVFIYDFSNLKIAGKVAETLNPRVKSTDNVEKHDYSSMDDKPNCCVLSILSVADALWVGRDVGDILIVSIDERSFYQRGFVITSLIPNYLLPPSERLIGAKGLNNCTDKSVLSFIETEDENMVRTTRICFWEEYSIAEIHQIMSHILQLQTEDKKKNENF